MERGWYRYLLHSMARKGGVTGALGATGTFTMAWLRGAIWVSWLYIFHSEAKEASASNAEGSYGHFHHGMTRGYKKPF